MEQPAARSPKRYRRDTPGTHWAAHPTPAPAHVPMSAAADGSESGWPRPTLSIVIPARNEAAALPQLVAELTESFRPLLVRWCEDGTPQLERYEILVVDDGSTDETPQVLAGLRGNCPELRCVRLPAHCGQSAAMFAGFRAARGYWVALLDADLQNPPAELARLWELLPGHDAAFGWRERRRDTLPRRAVSWLANRMRRWVLHDPIRDAGCSVRIFRRETALRLPIFHGAHRFLGPLLLREGCNIVQAPVVNLIITFGIVRSTS